MKERNLNKSERKKLYYYLSHLTNQKVQGVHISFNHPVCSRKILKKSILFQTNWCPALNSEMKLIQVVLNINF